MKNKILDLRAYFIAGPQDFPKLSIDDAIDKISVIIKSGVTVYQFRDKGTIYKNKNQRLEVAKRLQEVATLIRETNKTAFRTNLFTCIVLVCCTD